MEPTIHVLSDETINQIAAGEVIESPASVVKELVENALDAGAKNIEVEIVGGGLGKITVSDDGKGMGTEDAKLSLVRHATSKIERAQDLFHVVSKGFRGEALASIASISKLDLATAQEGETGIRLSVEKGEVKSERPLARTRGTTICVSALFYNVPARKKFQKSAAAISAEIFRMVTVLSLGHPEVGFELISNGRRAIQVPGYAGEFAEGMRQRAEELLGKEFLEGSFPLYFQEGPLEFFGILSPPTHTRVNRLGQHLYLNRRAVSCAEIVEALRAGYGTRLQEKRHPLFLLHLSVPADLIDVNVHPQKLQVRLREEELLQAKVEEAVTAALRQSPVGSRVDVSKPFERPQLESAGSSFRFEEEPSFKELALPLESPACTVLGQTDRFVLLEEGGEWVLLDAEAAHFRIVFEAILGKVGGGGESQGLLVPLHLELSAVEAAMVLTHKGAIEKVGFRLRSLGNETFLVEAIPPFLDEGEVKEVIAEMAHELQTFIGKRDMEKARRERLAFVAASHAKSGPRQSGQYLYEELKKCSAPNHCPKGQPTFRGLNHDTLEYLLRADQAATKGT